MMNADAAKDMLNYSSFGIPYIGGVFGTVPVFFTSNSFLANTYHPMVRFPAGGVPPPPYKFIATTQGSECGLGIISSGQNLINSSGAATLGVGWGLLRAGIGYDLNINAGGNGANRVIYLSIYAPIRIFWLVTVNVPLMIPIVQYDPYPGLLADSQPGGIISLDQANFNKDWDFIGAIAFQANTTVAPGFCFVSRNSALDIVSPTNYVGALSGVNTSTSGINPATWSNDFITQEGSTPTLGNLQHTTFTGRQTRWIFDEMQLNTPAIKENCPISCGLSGSTSFPIYGNGPDYSTIYLPNVTYNWSINGGASIVGANNTYNVQIITPPNPGTLYTLTLTTTSSCWTRSTTRSITCSVPVSRYGDLFLGIYHNGINYSYTYYSCLEDLTQGQGGLTLEFFLATTITVNGITYNVPTTSQTIVVMPTFVIYGSQAALGVVFTGFDNLQILASNNCSSTPVYYTNILQDTGCRVVAPTPKNPLFTLSPNPSSGNEITISQDISTSSETSASTGEEQAQSEAKNEEFTLLLYNKLQIKVRETTLNTPSKTISTEGLPNDVYFLHIISKDGNKVVKQVMILR